MSSRVRPTHVTALAVLMALVSLWWLVLAALYFFGRLFSIFELGFLGLFVWLYVMLLGFLGLIGLGPLAGLMHGTREAYGFTKIVAIIGLLFSIPAWFKGVGIVGAVIYILILYCLSRPAVKEFFA